MIEVRIEPDINPGNESKWMIVILHNQTTIGYPLIDTTLEEAHRVQAVITRTIDSTLFIARTMVSSAIYPKIATTERTLKTPEQYSAD